MSFQKYLQTISSIDPGAIYVENVRSFMRTTTFLAKFMCEVAVKDRIFEKRIGLVCPNDSCKRIIKSFTNEKEIPATIICHNCESNDEEEFEFDTSKLKRITFYKLRK
jgi:hypothetical protein